VLREKPTTCESFSTQVKKSGTYAPKKEASASERLGGVKGGEEGNTVQEALSPAGFMHR